MSERKGVARTVEQEHADPKEPKEPASIGVAKYAGAAAIGDVRACSDRKQAHKGALHDSERAQIGINHAHARISRGYCEDAEPHDEAAVDALLQLEARLDTQTLGYRPRIVRSGSSGAATPVLTSVATVARRGCIIEVEGNIGSGKSSLAARMMRWATLRAIRDFGDGRMGNTDGCVAARKEKNPERRMRGDCKWSSTQEGEEEEEEEKDEEEETEKERFIGCSYGRAPRAAVTHEELVNPLFLGAFYADKLRYGFSFQMYMMNRRMAQMDEARRQARREGRTVLLDRGAVGDALFAQKTFADGFMREDEFAIYQSECASRRPHTLSSDVDVLLYLYVPPAECFRRMHDVRAREAESSVPLSYLESLDLDYFCMLCLWHAGRSHALSRLSLGDVPPPTLVCVSVPKDAERSVSAQIDRLLSGERPSPRVTFVPAPPTRSDPRNIDVTEPRRIEVTEPRRIEVTEPRRIDVREPDAVRSPSFDTRADVERGLSEWRIRGLKSGADATFNWALRSSPDFRHLVMAYMAAPGHVQFYDPDLESATSTVPCS